MMKLVVFVPEEHLDPVKGALFTAGAGRLGLYKDCSWQTLGEGQFTPQPGSSPAIGELERTQRVPEYRLEVLLQEALLRPVLAALHSAHPYEEPAYEVYPVLTSCELGKQS